MSSYDWLGDDFIRELAERGLVTATFARLASDRRDQVVAAVLEAASREGPDRIGVKDVAARSGIPVGSLYQYFGDRDRLARAAALFVQRSLAEELAGFPGPLAGLPLRDALVAYLAYGLEWSRAKEPALRSFVVAAYGRAAGRPAFADPRAGGDGAGGRGPAEADDWLARELVEPVAEGLLAIVRSLVVAAADRGELRGDLDLDAASRVVHAVLVAVGDACLLPPLDSYYRLYAGKAEPEAMIETAVDLLWRGLAKEGRDA